MNHRHEPRTFEEYPYFKPIANADRPDPRAHGNITRLYWCKCGASRFANINNRYREYGPWHESPRPQQNES